MKLNLVHLLSAPTVSHAKHTGYTPMWIILPVLALIIIAFLVKAFSGRGK